MLFRDCKFTFLHVFVELEYNWLLTWKHLSARLDSFPCLNIRGYKIEFIKIYNCIHEMVTSDIRTEEPSIKQINGVRQTIEDFEDTKWSACKLKTWGGWKRITSPKIQVVRW